MTDAHAAMDGVMAGEGSAPRQPAPLRLELRNVYKSFGGVQVLQDVSFQLAGGEVVGLLGDNGAGKSTLIKVITGVHQPDQGEILIKVINPFNRPLTFARGAAVGQMVLVPVVTPAVEEASLEEIHAQPSTRGGSGGIVDQIAR